MISKAALANKLADGLSQYMEGSGIQQVRYEWEDIPGTRMLRFYVTSPTYRNLFHGDRQSLIWRAVPALLTQGEMLRISMIVTLTPEEAAGY